MILMTVMPLSPPLGFQLLWSLLSSRIDLATCFQLTDSETWCMVETLGCVRGASPVSSLSFSSEKNEEVCLSTGLLPYL